MNPIYYVNGHFIPQTEATISVHDLGLVRGYGVFDYTRTYYRRPFELEAHLERLEASAHRLELPLPHGRAAIAELVHQTIDHNPDLPELGLRIIVTGGISPSLLYPTGDASLLILATAPPTFPAAQYETGGHVITTKLDRLLPDVKSLNYITAVRALRQAKAVNAIEALYLDPDGYISEGTTSNFVLIHGRELITAPAGTVLNGITRNVVLRLAQEAGYTITRRLIHHDELTTCDEAFLTSSAKEVMGVTQVDKLVLPGPGPITRDLHARFQAYTASYRPKTR
jgi:branched-chain amino acid aminotransferase